ncbi:hypothetical protein [Flavobacterium hungaricum]|uniref:Uncharacterized protein n=1 Tax=Flavobacterium hungaricum TaxID=2082725 RepID=A0ABR9TMJ0_9FLAO|nr:hypothetical protein [Flavobacterium hungaricum]MBE8726585.1 hypothetical protein [Flavobacterium hungaricum]
MAERETSSDLYLKKQIHFLEIQKAIAKCLGLAELKSGIQIIRNEKGLRENEIAVDYIWVVNIARSFVGWGSIFGIKFKENKFREHENPAELIQGLFLFNNNKPEIFTIKSTDTSDEIINSFHFNLFKTNDNITLDGAAYQIRIVSKNIDTYIDVNNPNTEDWKEWERKIWELGYKLSQESNNPEMKILFE